MMEHLNPDKYLGIAAAFGFCSLVFFLYEVFWWIKYKIEDRKKKGSGVFRD